MACCFGRKRRKANAIDEETTLVNLPVNVKKLTIDHGRVVTAPPSPSKSVATWPVSLYSPATTARNSREMACRDTPDGLEITRPARRMTVTSSIVAGPPSPTSASFRYAPSAASGAPDEALTRRVSIPKSTLRQPPQEEMVTPASRSVASSSLGSCLAKEQQQPIRQPEPALTSPRPSLAAISSAAAYDRPNMHARVGTFPGTRVSARKLPSSIASLSTLPSPPPRMPPPKLPLPQPTNTEKARKPRPPPISTTTTTKRSKSSSRVPAAATTSTTTLKPILKANSLAAPSMSRGDSKHLPASPPRTPDRSRHSVFSVTSSQYSPTASIHPANQVQVVQAARALHVDTRPTSTARAPPTGGTRLTEIPPSSAATLSPRAVFPPDYALDSVNKRGSSSNQASLAGMIASGNAAPPTPGSYMSPNVEEGGFFTAPTSAASPRSLASPEIPLTSASLTFPPNLPDYSFTPTSEDVPDLPIHTNSRSGRSSRKGSQTSASSDPSDLASKPRQQQQQQPLSPVELASPGARSLAGMASERYGSGTAGSTTSPRELPQISLKGYGLKGTATVTISELAQTADLYRTRRSAYAGIY